MNNARLPGALDWLVEGSHGPTLLIGRSCASYAGQLHPRHRLTLVARDREAVSELLRQAPSGVPVVAAAESLPLAPCSFDRVVLNQNLHEFAPGLALSEFARVLRPGGHLAISYTVRDDAVPWVKRLVAIARSADPSAMPGGYGLESLDALTDSAYFPEVETRTFRRWVPIDRERLIAMMERADFAQSLTDQARADLAAEVGALYDNSARAPEPLLLPYRVMCWRAGVDHTELTAPLETPSDGLQIRL